MRYCASHHSRVLGQAPIAHPPQPISVLFSYPAAAPVRLRFVATAVHAHDIHTPPSDPVCPSGSLSLTKAILGRMSVIDPQLNAYLVVPANQALGGQRSPEADHGGQLSRLARISQTM
jgi:hypothetical protein